MQVLYLTSGCRGSTTVYAIIHALGKVEKENQANIFSLLVVRKVQQFEYGQMEEKYCQKKTKLYTNQNTDNTSVYTFCISLLVTGEVQQYQDGGMEERSLRSSNSIF